MSDAVKKKKKKKVGWGGGGDKMDWGFLGAEISQIHPALQQIPVHSTLELCLWLVRS